MTPNRLRSRGLLVAIAALLAAAFVVAGCGSSSSSSSDSSTASAESSGGEGGSGSGELTDVTFMADWAVPWVPQIPWVVAQQKGWFEEEGLDVTYQFPQGTAEPTKLVGAGKVNMAAVYTADDLSTNEQGLHSKVLMSLGSEKLPGGVCYMANSGITEPKDFEGKTIAVYNYPQSEYNFKYFFEHNGVNPENVNIVPAGENSATLLIAGRVDGIDGSTALECPDVEAKTGEKVETMLFDTEYGFPKTYFLELAANESWLEGNEEAAEAFVHTIQKATSWSEQHQEEALKIFIEANPDTVEAEIAELGFEGLKQSWCGETYSCWTPKKPIGWISPEVWQENATFYKEGGLIESDGPEASEMLTENKYLSSEYLPKP
jgi:putative hydroxymethylpyrimidine transport system substrate-binding protein